VDSISKGPQPAGWGLDKELPSPVTPGGWGGSARRAVATRLPARTTLLQGQTQTAAAPAAKPQVVAAVLLGAAVMPTQRVIGLSGPPLPSQMPAGWGPEVQASQQPASWGPPPKSKTVVKEPDSNDAVLAPNVALNEEGYHSLVRKGTHEMAAFIKRVGATHDYNVTNEGSLMGFAKYYSGDISSASLEHLTKELEKVATLSDGWMSLGLAATAPLTETGYNRVADRGTTDQMAAYIGRVAKTKGLILQNEGSLAGFAKFYSGEVSRSSMSRLNQEMDQISQLPDGWFKKGAPPMTGLSATLDDSGCRNLQAKAPKNTQEMSLFVRRVAESRLCGIADEAGLETFAKDYSGEAGQWPYSHMLSELDRIRHLPGSWLKGLGLD